MQPKLAISSIVIKAILGLVGYSVQNLEAATISTERVQLHSGGTSDESTSFHTSPSQSQVDSTGLSDRSRGMLVSRAGTFTRGANRSYLDCVQSDTPSKEPGNNVSVSAKRPKTTPGPIRCVQCSLSDMTLHSGQMQDFGSLKTGAGVVKAISRRRAPLFLHCDVRRCRSPLGRMRRKKRVIM